MRVHRLLTVRAAIVYTFAVAVSFGIVAVPSSAPPAEAASYACYGMGYPSRSFNVKYDNLNSTYTGYFNTTRSRWNSSGAGVSISLNASAASAVTAASYKDSWYGYYSYTWVLKVTKVQIKVNTRTLQAGAPSGQYLNWFYSTAVHEFGHALKLHDNPNTTSNSIMTYSRNRSTITTPQTYDVNNVKACY